MITQLNFVRIQSSKQRTTHAVVVQLVILRMAVLHLSDGQKLLCLINCWRDCDFLKKFFLILCSQGENSVEDYL